MKDVLDEPNNHNARLRKSVRNPNHWQQPHFGGC
jgi:uncharacterized protein (DUF1778 family)